MAEPTIAAGFAKALLDLAVSKGADRQALIEQSRIDLDALDDQDNRIPLATYIALMEAARKLTKDPALALHFGETFSMPELSIVGLITEAAETVGEAYEQTKRYARLMVDADEGPADLFEIIQDDDGTWVALTSRIHADYPQLTESAFARGVTMLNRNFGDGMFVKSIHFIHAAPEYRAEYDRIFKTPLVFNSDKNAMLVDDAFTSFKTGSPNRYVFGIFSERAEALLRELESSKTIRGRVESLLIPVLHTGDVDMARIADKLGVSRQTLYRWLKAEGVSYEHLLDELRCKMALHYLNGEKASVNETAYLVGFSDPAAFSRAFKRWTGTSPSMARKQASDGEPSSA